MPFPQKALLVPREWSEKTLVGGCPTISPFLHTVGLPVSPIQAGMGLSSPFHPQHNACH